MDIYCIKLASFESQRYVRMKLEKEIDAKTYATLSDSQILHK